MIATIHEDLNTVSVVWESNVPQPLSGSFLVAPQLATKLSQEHEDSMMEKSRIKPLLDFEYEWEHSESQDQIETIALWKDRGDQLLRIGDPTSAIPFYEAALSRSSVLSIGASIICSVQGYPKVAEVDCVEEYSIDAMFVDSAEDTTIPRSAILMCILENTETWQERILLNLARCLIQQAEIDTSNRTTYLKASVLACTLVLSVASFHDADGGEYSDTAQTALQLRSKTYISLSKWPHAIADAKRLNKLGHVQGRKLLVDIERERKHQATRDKKLVKAISKLVATATSELVSSCDHAPSIEETHEQENGASTVLHSKAASFIVLSPLTIFLALLGAFIIQMSIK